MKIWLVSDTHFYHENIKKFEDRPDNFNEIIIKNWNNLVEHDDLVIHLGDVIFGLNKEKNLRSIMASLPGKKVLCVGNHDNFAPTFYLEAGFDFVCDFFVLNGVAFSHAPLTPLPEQVKYNVHGHFHRGAHRDGVHPDRYFDHEYYSANVSSYELVQIEDTLSLFDVDRFLIENPFDERKKH